MKWQILENFSLPDDFLNLIRKYTNLSDGHYLAQFLWQRHLKTEDQLKSFLNFQSYQPSSYLEFGHEILEAKNRLENALIQGENVAIWGDFDADGITATSVLWEGLGTYFEQNKRLFYYIPNRLTESHGLNKFGLDKLASQNVKLIVTCDTGSTNFDEINYANKLGIDIIVTDHHTLPENRPNVIAIINPRYLPETHPLYHLSGVAVAYKLMECLADNWQKYKQFNPENLLDLVAIGLIADLVELKGDCRYLTQIGINQLQKTNRIGVKQLLELCQKKGDRPTDISYGIGPRINAVSRIYGNANFCVELLTETNPKKCRDLASKAELANERRKSLQEYIIKDVKKKLKRIDLSTTNVIVLADNQWELGILGLVAGKIAEEYGRPTILFSITENMARGSARSTNKIDLYNLILSQQELLLNFGGHPLAAGLSLLTENIELFTNNINQKLRQQYLDFTPTMEIDMVVTVADLCGELLKEIKYLEPCGMGNKVPKFLVKNCWFEKVEKDKNRVIYSKIKFSLKDESTKQGFWGVWWCNKNDQLPEKTRFDVIIERDFDANSKQAQIRLIEFRKPTDNFSYKNETFLIDFRNKNSQEITSNMVVIEKCPSNWQELQKQAKIAKKSHKKLALHYHYTPNLTPFEIWQQLLGIAKYLAAKKTSFNQEQLAEKLGLSLTNLQLGLVILAKIGLVPEIQENELKFSKIELDQSDFEEQLLEFLDFVAEEQFNKQYFTQISVDILAKTLNQ
jgi:single-stranded-DNA-specific exonuclease